MSGSYVSMSVMSVMPVCMYEFDGFNVIGVVIGVVLVPHLRVPGFEHLIV